MVNFILGWCLCGLLAVQLYFIGLRLFDNLTLNQNFDENPGEMGRDILFFGLTGYIGLGLICIGCIIFLFTETDIPHRVFKFLLK